MNIDFFFGGIEKILIFDFKKGVVVFSVFLNDDGFLYCMLFKICYFEGKR